MAKRRVKEVVGVVSTAAQLDDVVDALQQAGFDRAAISVLGVDSGKVRATLESIRKAEDDPKAPRAAPASNVAVREGQAAAVGIPMQIGAFAGAAVAVATGGALAVAIAATALGAAAGGGIGGLLAHAIGRKYQQSVTDKVADGGLVVWVAADDKARQAKAIEVMNGLKLKDVHAHEIELTDPAPVMIEPDPLLEREPT
ncbi:MAG: hypothetical protein U1E46_10715 [Hyphomicrobiales bacterium]